MADELKRYAPTARRLEQLREQGLSPASGAVTAVAVLLVATAAAIGGGGGVLHWLRGVLAHDLQAGLVAPQRLPALLAGRLLGAVAVVAGVALGALAVGAVAQILQGHPVQRSSKGLALPMGLAGRSRRRGAPGLALGAGLVGLGALIVLVALWLQQLAQGGHWPGWEQAPGALALGLRWLGVLAAVAVLHALALRWRITSQAQMTHRELLEERRETEGSWLKRRRTDRSLQRRSE